MLHPFTKRLQNTHNCTHFTHSSPVNCRHAIAPPRTLTPLWHSAQHVSVNSRRTDRLPLPSTTHPYSFTTLPLAAALHTLPSWCLFISFVFCACVNFSYRLNPLPLSLSLSHSPSLSVRFNVHSQSHSHFPFVQSSGCPLFPSPSFPLWHSFASSASYPRGQLDLSFGFSFSFCVAFAFVLCPAGLACLPSHSFSSFSSSFCLSLSLSLSASLLLFLLLSSLALALASASHLVIICIEKCQSQRAAQPPHDNRSDCPPSPSCTPSSTRLCSALLCCCPSVLFASVCCTSVYQQSRFDVALRSSFSPFLSRSFFAVFNSAIGQTKRERDGEGEGGRGSEAVGHAGAAAAYRGCQARRADQRRLMDRQTVQHTHSPSFTPPLPLPPWHIKHIF